MILKIKIIVNRSPNYFQIENFILKNSKNIKIIKNDFFPSKFYITTISSCSNELSIF